MSNRLCRAAGFSVLYVLMLWCTYEMFFFCVVVSVFDGFSSGRGLSL